MLKGFSRRGFLSGMASLLAGTSAFANAPSTSLRPRLRPTALRQNAAPGATSLIKSAGVTGKVGFAVADARSGNMLEGYAASEGLPPASVTKALTAMYALEVLGGGHRFVTRLIATGPVQNGVLAGDLVLAGGGDPTLDTNTLAAMAGALKKAGVREVKGKFFVWGGALPYVHTIDSEQLPYFGYSPSVSGLSLNYNRVHFEWKRGANGWRVTMDARSDRYRPDVDIARMRIAKRGLPVYTYDDKNGRDNWTVASEALGNGGARWLPVRKPELYAGQVFRTLARSHGIVLREPEKTGRAPAGTALVSQPSIPLRNILKSMLKYSTNITAEMVGMAASKKRGATVVSLKSSAREMSRWAADTLGMKNAHLVDHSGLGDASRMHADELVRALVQAKRRTELQPILKNILLRDDNGKINKSHPVKVQAKTGTLNFVSGLAGYMKARDGSEMAFAIFVADTKKKNAIRQADKERPKGARSWNKRAKILQQKLIERWDRVYG